MPSVTTADLVSRASAASDMRDNFVTPTQWMYWATQERLALDLFLARSGWPLPYATQTITVTGSEGGVYNVNPSTGVMAIVAVHQVKDQRTRLLKHQNAVDFLSKVPGYTGSPRGNSVFYRVNWSGDNLTLGLYPEPISGETYLVTYIPHPAKLVLASPGTNEATSVAYPMGWEERIVLGMARRALIKEESSTSSIDSEIALWPTLRVSGTLTNWPTVGWISTNYLPLVSGSSPSLLSAH
jgi:hypothetical protein